MIVEIALVFAPRDIMLSGALTGCRCVTRMLNGRMMPLFFIGMPVSPSMPVPLYEIEQHGLSRIVDMMRCGQHRSRLRSHELRKPFVPKLARRHLDRDAFADGIILGFYGFR